MTITRETTDRHEILVLSGRIDAYTAPAAERDLSACIREITRPSYPIVLDCAALTYISSAGLRVVIRISRLCPGRLVVQNAAGPVRDLLKTVGLSCIATMAK